MNPKHKRDAKSLQYQASLNRLATAVETLTEKHGWDEASIAEEYEAFIVECDYIDAMAMRLESAIALEGPSE